MPASISNVIVGDKNEPKVTQVVIVAHDLGELNTPTFVYLKIVPLVSEYSNSILEPVKPKPSLQVEFCTQ